MSTRSTTHFAYDGKPYSIVYRHADGYPEGAGKDLIKFLKECAELKDPRFNDPTYLAAKYVVFLADKFNNTWELGNAGEIPKQIKNKSKLDFLSVGVMLSDPEDIDYRYVVECSEKENGLPKVTCYSLVEETIEPIPA